MRCIRATSSKAILLVTHYQRLLNLHRAGQGACDDDGRIVKSGGKELALELEERGYDWVEEEVGG